MGFKYRKSIKLIPGVKINISKSGISTSLGGNGYTANISSKGVKHTISAPETGLSFSKTYSKSKKVSNLILDSRSEDNLSYIQFIPSFNLSCDNTSDSLWDLKMSVVESAKETRPLVEKLNITKEKVIKYEKKTRNLMSRISKKYKENNIKKFKEESDLIEKISSDIFDKVVFIDFESEKKELLEGVLEAARNLWKSEGVWDNTDYVGAEGILSKRKVDISGVKEPFNLKTKSTSGPLFSISGNTLYLYPEFIHFGNNSKNDNYIKIKDLKVISFELNLPSNGDEHKYSDLDKSKPVWLFSTKDGSVDLRYKDNKKVPAAYYSYINIKDDKNFDISIILTNRALAKDFVGKMNALINSF